MYLQQDQLKFCLLNKIPSLQIAKQRLSEASFQRVADATRASSVPSPLFLLSNYFPSSSVTVDEAESEVEVEVETGTDAVLGGEDILSDVDSGVDLSAPTVTEDEGK